MLTCWSIGGNCIQPYPPRLVGEPNVKLSIFLSLGHFFTSCPMFSSTGPHSTITRKAIAIAAANLSNTSSPSLKPRGFLDHNLPLKGSLPFSKVLDLPFPRIDLPLWLPIFVPYSSKAEEIPLSSCYPGMGMSGYRARFGTCINEEDFLESSKGKCKKETELH